jgi:hypothetical protein
MMAQYRNVGARDNSGYWPFFKVNHAVHYV